jgi:hypothetical protein
MGRGRIALLGAAALLSIPGGVAHPGPAHAQPAPMSIGVRVSTASIGARIAPGFLGLALEYSEVPQLAGTDPEAVNPLFKALLAGLDPAGKASIRIGGISTDRTWWPVRNMSTPLGIVYQLSSRWMAQARALAQATGAQLMPGVELEAASARISGVEAGELVSGVGKRYIQALEIGNEPPLYSHIPWYKVLGGRALPWYSRVGTPVFSRTLSWNAQAFVSEFRATMRVMPRGVPLAGPALGLPSWLKAFGSLFSTHSELRVATYHAYPLNACIHNPSLRAYPTVAHLLEWDSSRLLIPLTAPFISLVHRAGMSFRVAEMGTVTCNGRAGVSNSFASALWVLDSLFSLAADGVDGVNLHTFPGNPNALFDFSTAGGRPVASVQPIYYGALAFARAAPAGSQLLRVGGAGQVLRAWAVRTPAKATDVVLINASQSASRSVVLQVAGAGKTAPAYPQWLKAASAGATSGVTLGGRTFGKSTSTGVLGTPLPYKLLTNDGLYRLTLPAASAVLLTIPPPSASTAASGTSSAMP